MRTYYKGWQNKRPGWTRRARWYQDEEGFLAIRVQYEDEDGRVNRLYSKREEAQAEYDAFCANELSVMEFLAERQLGEEGT